MKTNLTIHILHAGILILFIVLSIFNDWQYDESWTYNGIRDSNIFELVTYQNFKFANHQILNSLYFKLLQEIEVSHVIYYRILSLIGFVIFFYTITNILNSLKINKYLTIFLIVAPYVTYFVLGRGYGLALAFFSLSFLFLLRDLHKPRVWNSYIFIITGIISILSIFSFLYGFIAMFLIFFFSRKNDILNAHFIFQFLLVVASVIYIYYAGNIINDYDTEIIGSGTFIKNGPFSSIIADFTHYNTLNHFNYFEILRFLVIISITFPVIVVMINKLNRKIFIQRSGLILMILGISFFLMILANVIFEAKYPLGRAIMNLEFLILLVVIIALNIIQRKPAYIFLVILSLISLSVLWLNYANLFRPSIIEVLKQTNDNILYISGKNPNIKMINSLYNIKDDSKILQSTDMDEIINWIEQSNEKEIFLLTSYDNIEAINLNKTDITRNRVGFLVKIKK